MQTSWDKEANELLELLYNENKSDKQIADYMHKSILAVAKQRSNLGFVKFKRNVTSYIAKEPKVQVEALTIVGHYINKDGSNCFIDLGKEDTAAKNIAHRLAIEKGLKEITILKPYSKLVFKSVHEVKL